MCAGLRRHFWAAVVFFVLLAALVLPLGWMIGGSSPTDGGRGFRPSMSIPEGVDVDGNRVDDKLDLEIKERLVNGTERVFVNVIVMVSGEAEGAAGAFAGSGGFVTTDLWDHAIYGFGGRIPFGRIHGFAHGRSDVFLIEKEVECDATVAYAAQQVGARSYVWSTLDLRGDAASSTAVLDTGIDASHVDFAAGYGAGDFSKKIVGWSNQVTSSATPFDDDGHGSHCAGLAAGDGFFSVDSLGYATAKWSTDLGGYSSGSYYAGGIMVNQTGVISASVRWSNTANGKLNSLSLYYGDKSLSSWTPLTSVSTNSENVWYTLSYNVASVPAGGYDMYHLVASISSGEKRICFFGN
jgi:hypothetical protein